MGPVSINDEQTTQVRATASNKMLGVYAVSQAPGQLGRWSLGSWSRKPWAHLPAIAVCFVLAALTAGAGSADTSLPVSPSTLSPAASVPGAVSSYAEPDQPPPQDAWPRTLVDQLGVAVLFDAPPRRVVSLLPSLTEAVCALQRCPSLVGVDRYSNWPEEVTKVPVLGGGLDANVEAVLAARPDVVLVATSARNTVAQLRRLGVKVLALEPATLLQLRSTLLLLGRLFDLPPDTGAAALWQRIEGDLKSQVARVPASWRGARVFFESSPGPYGASPVSYVGELLHLLGLRNVLGAGTGPFPLINPEFVVAAQPDVLMSAAAGGEAAFDYPGWSHLAALRAGRICHFAAASADILARAGPRVADGAKAVVDCLLRLTPPDA